MRRDAGLQKEPAWIRVENEDGEVVYFYRAASLNTEGGEPGPIQKSSAAAVQK